ncbi:DUF4345 domain-containing protein [Myroides odoratus]|uniref:DUF4345 domain-containing protein n=1 Tax=Myroides odoratus TaxID=256 RepID=UPI0039AFE244
MVRVDSIQSAKNKTKLNDKRNITSMNKFKNLHLTSSVVMLSIIALVYGFFPHKIIPVLGEFNPVSNDLKNVFKAIMGLYLSIAIFWTFGIIKPQLWYGATLVNILFMFGLASGRILSFLIDGLPDISMLSGVALEFIIGVWGVLSLKRFSKPA